jgi:dihydrodipicolinate synthase/N-acetylneuraminate lyase
MFGPMPDNPGGINVLPYVTEVSKNIVPLSNFDMFAAQVIRDLDEAEALLKDVDPITKFTIAELNPDPVKPLCAIISICIARFA